MKNTSRSHALYLMRFVWPPMKSFNHVIVTHKERQFRTYLEDIFIEARFLSFNLTDWNDPVKVHYCPCMDTFVGVETLRLWQQLQQTPSESFRQAKWWWYQTEVTIVGFCNSSDNTVSRRLYGPQIPTMTSSSYALVTKRHLVSFICAPLASLRAGWNVTEASFWYLQKVICKHWTVLNWGDV